MAKIKMVARQPMRYRTRRLRPGDLFDARSRQEATLYEAIGRARRYVEVSPPPGALEHIEAQRADPEAPEAEPELTELEQLRAQADAMGLKYHGRMREPGLRRLIEQANASNSE